jgi:NAD(P)H-flavin reductase
VAIVRKYHAKVESIINPLKDIYTVTFFSDKKIKFFPGQFLHLALDDYDGVGQWPDSRCFSMQSNPEEENIKITYTSKGKFTSRMAKELKKDKEIWLKMPYGDIFQRGHDKTNCVFIAGGTGITPFLSLFNSGEFNSYVNPKIYLGFRSKKYNIYEKEISEIRNDSCNLDELVKFIYQDIDGILNVNSIFEQNGLDSTYFISGPPIMIKSFKKYLIENCVAESKVITDDWE